MPFEYFMMGDENGKFVALKVIRVREMCEEMRLLCRMGVETPRGSSRNVRKYGNVGVWNKLRQQMKSFDFMLAWVFAKNNFQALTFSFSSFELMNFLLLLWQLRNFLLFPVEIYIQEKISSWSFWESEIQSFLRSMNSKILQPFVC